MISSADARKKRQEQDLIGSLELPADELTGIHTARARENFSITGIAVHSRLFRAMGMVKLAAAITNGAAGVWSDDIAEAIMTACRELAAGELDHWNQTDSMQGGAGTSLNMSCNEIIANRALQLGGWQPGDYSRISPIDDINLHQSTNDVVPTALRLAAMALLDEMEDALVNLQERCQEAEERFADVVKVGRTQLQDAVLTTLGRTFGGYAEVFSRDRWRLFKIKERLRVVNLGGTAIGTGIGAGRQYSNSVIEALKELSGRPLSRAEHLIDATQNMDVFVETAGLLSAFAASLNKVCGDLRLTASGPDAGLGEINLPAVQSGSSIMPGKVNPVIPEACQQVATQFIGRHAVITSAAGNGNLELNQFLPLIADNLLRGIDELRSAARLLAERCIAGIEVNRERCRSHVENSTALITALAARLGYDRAENIHKQARAQGESIRQHVIAEQILSEEEFEQMISPAAVLAPGSEGEEYG